MKIILVIFVATSVWTFSKEYSPEEWRDLVMALESECKEGIEIEDATIQKAKQTERIDKSNKALLKFVYCIAMNAGFVDEEGKLNKDILKYHFKALGMRDDDITKSYQKCTEISDVDVQIQIALYYECFHENMPLAFRTN